MARTALVMCGRVMVDNHIRLPTTSLTGQSPPGSLFCFGSFYSCDRIGGSPGPAPRRPVLPAALASQTNPATRPATRVPPPGALPAEGHGPVLFLQPLLHRSLHTPAGHLYKTNSKSSPVIRTSCVCSGVRGAYQNTAGSSPPSLRARECPRC